MYIDWPAGLSRRSSARRPALALAVTTALLLAAARVFAGEHYLHDVAAGLLLGMTVTAAGTVALTPLSRRLRPPPPQG